MRVCLGGTFDRLHLGHKALLDAAKGADEIYAGVASDRMAARKGKCAPWEERAEAVRAYLDGENVNVTLLEDEVGPAATEDYDAIIVSPETRPGAGRINQMRRKAKLKELLVRIVPHALSEDLIPISASRIKAGDIDAEGKRLTPVRIALGSGNPIKAAGVQDAFERWLPVKVETRGFAVPSGVHDQPTGGETLTGARNRALLLPKVDYRVGVEAGLTRMAGHDEWVDVQACCIVDIAGWQTVGWGPGFVYPDWVSKRAVKGETVSEILGPLSDVPRIGSTIGAVGFLSDGKTDRKAITAVAVEMALTPRIHRDLYFGMQSTEASRRRAAEAPDTPEEATDDAPEPEAKGPDGKRLSKKVRRHNL